MGQQPLTVRAVFDRLRRVHAGKAIRVQLADRVPP